MMSVVMPFRSLETLEGWLSEFRTLGYPLDPGERVIAQDGADGADTGLVALQLVGGLSVYIQPESVTSRRWMVTVEQLDGAVELAPGDVARLASELATVSALCAFLEAKSLAAGD